MSRWRSWGTAGAPLGHHRGTTGRAGGRARGRVRARLPRGASSRTCGRVGSPAVPRRCRPARGAEPSPAAAFPPPGGWVGGRPEAIPRNASAPRDQRRRLGGGLPVYQRSGTLAANSGSRPRSVRGTGRPGAGVTPAPRRVHPRDHVSPQLAVAGLLAGAHLRDGRTVPESRVLRGENGKYHHRYKLVTAQRHQGRRAGVCPKLRSLHSCLLLGGKALR